MSRSKNETRISRSSADDQLDRFKEAARALECDDDPKAFERVMEKIAKAKPKPQKLK